MSSGFLNFPSPCSLRQGLTMSQELTRADCPMRLRHSSLSLSPLESHTSAGAWTRVLMFVQQTPSQLHYLPSPALYSSHGVVPPSEILLRVWRTPGARKSSQASPEEGASSLSLFRRLGLKCQPEALAKELRLSLKSLSSEYWRSQNIAFSSRSILPSQEGKLPQSQGPELFCFVFFFFLNIPSASIHGLVATCDNMSAIR